MSSSETDRFDPSKRRLCPDGACVGLLDDSGRCKECGRTASGKIEAAPAAAWPQDAGELEQDPGTADAAAFGDLEGDGGFDSKRKLCPDGACVGVIGPDGRCGVCGQAG